MPEVLQLKDKLDYAYKWFEYQAGQRLTAFNFLLVLMGALSFGYYTAYEAKAYLYATVAAVFGAFVSLAFYVLDRRNEELVDIGRRALEHIENLPEFSALPEGHDPCRLSIHARTNSGYRWLRAIQLVLCGLFILASLASGWKLIAGLP